MYISEIAPLNLRGGLGTVNQLAVTVGLLLSQVLGIEQILGTNDGWPVLLGLAICPAILQLLLLPICPESPRYLLITKQWEEEARKGRKKIIQISAFDGSTDFSFFFLFSALRRLRASNQVEEDIEEMRAEERAQQSESHMTTMELICSPTLRAPLIIGIVMQLSQQLSGINAVKKNSIWRFQESDKIKFHLFCIGILLFHLIIYEFWFNRRECKIRNNWYWCDNGCDDTSLNTAYGSYGSTYTSFIWTWWNVYILNIHHDIIFDQGKLSIYFDF